MDARKILRLAIFSNLVLGSTSIQNARADPAKVESPCDKDGPFAPRVDKDLLRKDLVIEPAELPRVRESAAKLPSKRGSAAFARTRKPASRSFCLIRHAGPEREFTPEATKEIPVCRGATSATCRGATSVGTRLHRFS